MNFLMVLWVVVGYFCEFCFVFLLVCIKFCMLREILILNFIIYYEEICGFKIVVCDDEILIFNVNFFMILFFVVFDYYNFC